MQESNGVFRKDVGYFVPFTRQIRFLTYLIKIYLELNSYDITTDYM
jgi:hypothetical protein